MSRGGQPSVRVGGSGWRSKHWRGKDVGWRMRVIKTFRAWFRIDVHNVVVDVADDEVEGEEL